MTGSVKQQNKKQQGIARHHLNLNVEEFIWQKPIG